MTYTNADFDAACRLNAAACIVFAALFAGTAIFETCGGKPFITLLFPIFGG